MEFKRTDKATRKSRMDPKDVNIGITVARQQKASQVYQDRLHMLLTSYKHANMK